MKVDRLQPAFFGRHFIHFAYVSKQQTKLEPVADLRRRPEGAMAPLREEGAKVVRPPQKNS